MAYKALRWLATAVMISGTTACDNVAWGGVEVHLQAPPSAELGAQSDTSQAPESDRSVRLPETPVLYMGRADTTGQVTLVPVGAIAGDSLSPFPSEDEQPGYRAAFAREFLEPGSEFVLFSRGVRVGHFTVQDLTTDESFCTPRPAAHGVAELRHDAMDARTFLALPEDVAKDVKFKRYAPTEDDRAQRIALLNMTGELIPQVGARWPTSLVAARKAMDVFPLQQDGTAIAGTFLFRDELAVQPTEPSAYSLFVMATPKGDGGDYEPAYVWYRLASQEGKGAARYFDELDWDGDGKSEVLLEVLGERKRWNAALAQRSGGWQRTFEDPCGANAPPVEATGR